MARGRRAATADVSDPQDSARSHLDQLEAISAGPADRDWRVRNAIAHALERDDIDHASDLRRAFWRMYPDRAPGYWEREAAEPFDERLAALMRLSELRARDLLMAGGLFDLLSPQAGYESLARELSLPRTTGDQAERLLAARAPSRGLGDFAPAASVAAWYRGIRAMARTAESIDGDGDLRRGMGLHLQVDRPAVLHELAAEEGWSDPCLLLSPREDEPQMLRVWICLERSAQMSAGWSGVAGHLALRAVVEATEVRRDALPMMIDAETAPWQLVRAAREAIASRAPSQGHADFLEQPRMYLWSGKARGIVRPDARRSDPIPNAADVSALLGREFCAHARSRWVLPAGGDALRLSCDLCGRRQVAAVPLHRVDPSDPELPADARAAVETARRSPSPEYLRAEAIYRFIADPAGASTPLRAEDILEETIPLRRSDWVTGALAANTPRGQDLHTALAARRRA